MKTAVMGSVHSDGWDLLNKENFMEKSLKLLSL